MPVWHRKVNIHQHIDNEDITPEECAARIIAEFKRAGIRDDDLDMHLEELEWAGRDDDVKWFDVVLEDLYTWGDRNRVWLGESVGGTS